MSKEWWREFFNPAAARDGSLGYKAPMRVFWVGFLVRLAYMTLAHTYKVRGLDEHFKFGYEAGRIAKALVTGYGYADPFAHSSLPHTGPTAWLPPLYPLLLAGIFKVFGVYTKASAWVIFAIQCALSGSTAAAVWELGARFAGRKCGRWAGWIYALDPAAMQYAVAWIWEMTVTTWLFAWLLVLLLRMREEPGKKTVARWCWFGLIWALIGLSNSTVLLFLPVSGVWLLWFRRGPGLKRAWVGAVLSGIIFLLCLTPWTVRNWEVFHTFIPMRGNLGVELYLGNGPGANGFLMEFEHPFTSPIQLQTYKAMGEVRYARMRGNLAKAQIRRYPGLFLRNSLKRFFFFWAGVPHPGDQGWALEYLRIFNFSFGSVVGLLGLALALARKKLAAGLWAWAFGLIPLTYYFVTVHARFRHPLEPLICVLGVYLFQSAERRGAERGRLGRGSESMVLQ